jgi:hypothetical protein
MISILLAFSLATSATAQIVNGMSYVPAPSGYGPVSAPPSQVTQPPSQTDFYQQMPYSSFISGGYSSLNCGYGYYKSSDGSCQQQTWVCHQADLLN